MLAPCDYAALIASRSMGRGDDRSVRRAVAGGGCGGADVHHNHLTSGNAGRSRDHRLSQHPRQLNDHGC